MRDKETYQPERREWPARFQRREVRSEARRTPWGFPEKIKVFFFFCGVFPRRFSPRCFFSESSTERVGASEVSLRAWASIRSTGAGISTRTSPRTRCPTSTRPGNGFSLGEGMVGRSPSFFRLVWTTIGGTDLEGFFYSICRGNPSILTKGHLWSDGPGMSRGVSGWAGGSVRFWKSGHVRFARSRTKTLDSKVSHRAKHIPQGLFRGSEVQFRRSELGVFFLSFFGGFPFRGGSKGTKETHPLTRK